MPLQFDLIDINLYCYFLMDTYNIDNETIKEMVVNNLNQYYDDEANAVDYTKVTEEIEKSIKLLAREVNKSYYPVKVS